jgi:hypothetical protein
MMKKLKLLIVAAAFAGLSLGTAAAFTVRLTPVTTAGLSIE